MARLIPKHLIVQVIYEPCNRIQRRYSDIDVTIKSITNKHVGVTKQNRNGHKKEIAHTQDII